LIEYIREGASDEELVDIFLKGIHNREPFYKEEDT
jgi:cyclic pyranopterin phosphate synthase